MKRMNRTLSLLLAVVMILSAAPLTPIPALLPTAKASNGDSIDIDFNYARDHNIGSAEDALKYEASKGYTAEKEVDANYYRSAQNKFKWRHPTGVAVAGNGAGSLNYYLSSTSDDDKYISLTADLSLSYTGNTVWEPIVITTDKVLDLNGKGIDVMYGRNRKGKAWYEDHYKQSGDPNYHNSTFIIIDKGATLTIIDSSMYDENGTVRDGTGHIRFHGYMVSPHYSQMNFYTTRDLFHVDNGNLVIYGGTYQAGRQKDQLKDNFSWSKLKTVIGNAVELGVAVASYSTGISAALATQSDVNETIMNERKASSETDDLKDANSFSTPKRDGADAKPEKKKDTPEQKGSDLTGVGRDQTIGEKKATNNEKTAAEKAQGTGTEKPTDDKNKSNGDNTAKENGSVKGVDYASRLAKAEKGVVDSIVNKDGIMGMVNNAFNLVEGIAGMVGQDETSRVTQSIMGTVVKCGNNGTFVSYGGTYKGFGSTPNTRNAVIEIVRSNNQNNPVVPNRYNGGQAYIFDGVFEAYTGANIFNMVRANTNQQRQQATRGTDGKLSTKTVTLSLQETNGLEQVYFENQEAVATGGAEPILINTRNVVVRGGTFRCYYELMNMGIAEADGAGEGNFVKFPGTPGSVNLGVESYGPDFIRDGRIQIVDRYGDGALVLMDEEEDDTGNRTGVYHYRLFCSDEELRYKTYLDVYPNTADTNSTYSMYLRSYYGTAEQQDISKIWEISNDNPRDAAFANDEKYFSYPIDDPWLTDDYYVAPELESIDPDGSNLEMSDVWYYPKPVSTTNKEIGTFAYGDVYYKVSGSSARPSLWHDTDGTWTSNMNRATGYYVTTRTTYRVNMKWFRYRIYRVDPLTKTSISESAVFGSDKPLAEVVYGTSTDSIKCLLNLHDIQEQILNQKDKNGNPIVPRLRDGTVWQGYKQGELYRIVFSMDEYLTYGWESDTRMDGRLDTATAETSILFACYSVNEMKDGEDQSIEDYTPLQWISEPEVGKTSKITICNAFAGKVDFEGNNNKIFDVYYQWWEVDENGENKTLLAGTDNVYVGKAGNTQAENLAGKKNHTPKNWFRSDGTPYNKPNGLPYIYRNTIDPKDPNIDNLDPDTGMPKSILEWRASNLHAYTKELCAAEKTHILAVDKSKDATLKNNDLFATNTDQLYIPAEFAGKRVRVQCIVVNLKWTAAYDKLQTFWSHVVEIPDNRPVVSFVSEESKLGLGSMPDVRVEKGAQYELPACTFSPPQQGYAFDGWQIGSKVYKAGEKYTVNGDTVCRATWKLKDVSVVFDPGDGSGSMEPLTVGYGEKLPCYECTFTPPTGKVFNYWTIDCYNPTQDKDWHLGAVGPGEYYTIRVGFEQVFTAKYRYIKVSYDANGGSGKMPDYTLQASDNGILKLPYCRFTAPEGKRFSQWEINGKRYDEQREVALTADTVLKAVWVDLTLYFNASEGTGTMANITANKGKVTLPECTFTPPAGKQLRCWRVAEIVPGGTTTICNAKPGDTIKITRNAIAYAVWEDIPPAYYTVYWAKNNGVGEVPAPMEVDNGGAYILPELMLDPPASSDPYQPYYFRGYCVNTGHNETAYNAGTLYQPGDTITMNSDKTVVPIFNNSYVKVTYRKGTATDEDGYTYNFNVDEGTMPENQYCRYRGSITEPAAAPTAEGMTFVRWDYDFSTENVITDTAIYGVWEPTPYTVTATEAEYGTYTWVRTGLLGGSATTAPYKADTKAYVSNRIRIDAVPEPGYMLSYAEMIRNDTGEVIQTWTGNTNTQEDPVLFRPYFTMPAADVTVNVLFEKKLYSVTLGWPETGAYGAYGKLWTSFGPTDTYTWNGNARGGALRDGDTVGVRVWSSEAEYYLNRHETSERWVEIYPAAYCELTSVSVTANSVTTDITGTKEFTLSGANVQVDAVFTPTEAYFYNVYVGSDGLGQASFTVNGVEQTDKDGAKAEAGDVIVLSAEPNPGYRLKEWAVRNNDYPNSETVFVGNHEMKVADLVDIQNGRFTFRTEYPNANPLGETYRMNRIRVYAIFEEIPPLTVTFVANGGKGEMADAEVLPGEALTLPECGYAPDGCKEFVGWKIGTRIYQPGDTANISVAAQAVAQWADVEHVAYAGETIKAPTCTERGTAKLVCVRCGEDLGTRAIPARHDVRTVDSVAPTCKTTGLSEGEKCVVCGEVIKAQEVLPKGDHTPGSPVYENPKAATATAPAEWDEVTYCTVCGTKISSVHKTGDRLPEGAEQPGPTFTPGDVDGNGKVETADARYALRRAIGLEKYAEGSREFLACDVNRDGKAGTDDARYILRRSIGLKDPKIW